MKLTRRTREKNVMALQVARKLKLLWKPEGVRLNSFSPPVLGFCVSVVVFPFFFLFYIYVGCIFGREWRWPQALSAGHASDALKRQRWMTSVT